MTELLDIVDDQDNVIGSATRTAVHAGEHFHRSAHIIVYNTLEQVFIQLRSRTKDTNPGLWDTSAAGHVESGESYIECAVRELREELGVDIQPDELNLIGNLQPRPINGFEFTHVFAVRYDSNLVLQSEEIDDGRWLMPAELDSWIADEGAQFTDVFKLIWSMYRQRVT